MNTSHATRALARRAGCWLALLAFFAGSVSAQVTFNVSFDDSANVLTSQEKGNITSHIQEAGRRWVAYIPVDGPRAIEVLVSISGAPTANGGSAAAGAIIGTIEGRTTYEQGVATKLRNGVDSNGANPDAAVSIGLDYLRNELWFDPNPAARTATVPSDKTDALSVLMHEMGHVLAYNGWADGNGNPPDTYWSVWDSWMIPGSPTRFAGPAADNAWDGLPELTTGNINHWGNQPGSMTITAAAAMLRAGERCRLVASLPAGAVPVPRVCDAPPSVDRPSAHTAALAAGGDLLDQLMNGVVFYRGTRYDISPLDLGVLDDVGLRHDFVFGGSFDY
jgi:hypothetical protein